METLVIVVSLFLSLASSEGSGKSAQVCRFAREVTACTLKVGILIKTYSLRPDCMLIAEHVCIKNGLI